MIGKQSAMCYSPESRASAARMGSDYRVLRNGLRSIKRCRIRDLSLLTVDSGSVTLNAVSRLCLEVLWEHALSTSDR